MIKGSTIVKIIHKQVQTINKNMTQMSNIAVCIKLSQISEINICSIHCSGGNHRNIKIV